MESVSQLEVLLYLFNLERNASAPDILEKYLEKTLQIKFQRILVSQDPLQEEFLRYHEAFVKILKILQAQDKRLEMSLFSTDQLGKFFFNQGVYAFCKDDFMLAGEKFQEAYKINKHNIFLLIYLGIILTIRKNHYAAEKYFSEAMQRDPNNADVWFYAAENYLKAGRYNNAITYFEKAKKLDPTNFEIALRLRDCMKGLVKNQDANKEDTLFKKIVRYVRGTINK